jgi:hypothetical protein
MGKMNVGRILLGGLVAGVVMNIGEFLFNGVIYAQKMQDWAKQYNLPPVSDSFVMKAVALTFLAGIVSVFTYAAIRPRFGAGAKTAIIAGLILWFGYYFYAGLLIAFLGYSPIDVTVISLVWGIVELPLATVIGAWLYKE